MDQAGSGENPTGRRSGGRSRKNPWPVYVTIALSGMTAIGAEVVWTRLLSLTLGGTVYAFSIILAVFLFGLGIGSGVGACSPSQPASGICARLVPVFFDGGDFLDGLHARGIAAVLADSPSHPCVVQFSTEPGALPLGVAAGDDFVGREFSARARGGRTRGQDPARLVGGIYAANTVGGILGGVGFSIVFIPLQARSTASGC